MQKNNTLDGHRLIYQDKDQSSDEYLKSIGKDIKFERINIEHEQNEFARIRGE